MLTDALVAVLAVLLREELLEVGASALRVRFVRSITNNTVRAAHCHTHSWSELPIHAGADALAAFPGVRGAAADVLDPQGVVLDPCSFAPGGLFFYVLPCPPKLGTVCCRSLLVRLLRCVALTNGCHHFVFEHAEPVGVGIFGLARYSTVDFQ
jgi:hypothetical protein